MRERERNDQIEIDRKNDREIYEHAEVNRERERERERERDWWKNLHTIKMLFIYSSSMIKF